ncbi:MAG TPA: TIR and AAA domain-containing protein [Pyrinomonadaceae bacterium]|nr:TIR and AAA domain-containing protein [Pyrinomonadaceae bacterium]
MKRVFISYSHDSVTHSERVRALVTRLRGDDVTVIIDHDKLPGGPAEGWPAWSERQVVDADQVLVVCTALYSSRYEGNQPPGTGLGASSEAAAIRQAIYDQAGFNLKFRVIVFDPVDTQHIPTQLKRYHAFQPTDDEGYANLLAWLVGEPVTHTKTKVEPDAVVWPTTSADYDWPLADRKEEFASFQRIISGQSSQRIMLVRGVSNTGKTVFVSELFKYARSLNLPAALLDCKGCPSLDALFETMRLDLGKKILPNAHSAAGQARFFNLISDLQNLNEPLLLVFDTYQEASNDAQTWLEAQFLPRLAQAPVAVVIGGQHVPEPSKYAWNAVSDFRELRPIEAIDDWRELNERKWRCALLQDAHIQGVLAATRGNPGLTYAALEAVINNLLRSRPV